MVCKEHLHTSYTNVPCTFLHNFGGGGGICINLANNGVIYTSQNFQYVCTKLSQGGCEPRSARLRSTAERGLHFIVRHLLGGTQDFWSGCVANRWRLCSNNDVKLVIQVWSRSQNDVNAPDSAERVPGPRCSVNGLFTDLVPSSSPSSW